MSTNAVLLIELALQLAIKQQEIAIMFRNANGGDISDEVVAQSSVSRDVALMRAEQAVEVGTAPAG